MKQKILKGNKMDNYIALGEICQILNGYAFKSSNYVNSGIRVIRIANVQKGEIVDSNPQFYPESSSHEIKKYLLKQNDLLISLTGNVGRVGLLTQNLLPAALNQRVACLRILNEIYIYKKYIYNILNSDYFEQQCILNSQGIAQKNMSTEWLKEFSIYLPSVEMQREIAAVLDKASELVALRKRQLTELDTLAESVFYDMFGDPITNEKGWSHKTLSELGDWKSGGTPSRNNSGYFCGDTLWVSSGELNNMYIEDTNEHITEDAILNSNTKKIKVGSILLGMYDTAALKSSITKKIMCCNQAIAYSRLKDNVVDTLFVYTVIQICKDEYKKLQRGIRQKNLNLSMIKAISIIYPPLPLQNQFASIIEKIEEQKTKVKEALKESEDLFQRLMQDMFNPEYHKS